MSYILRIQINARIVNPSKQSLMILKKILMNQELHNLEMCYSTVESANNVTPNLKVSRIISPVIEKGSEKNIKIIERILKVTSSNS